MSPRKYVTLILGYYKFMKTDNFESLSPLDSVAPLLVESIFIYLSFHSLYFESMCFVAHLAGIGATK